MTNTILGYEFQIRIGGLNGASLVLNEFNLSTGSQRFIEQPQPATLTISAFSHYAIANQYMGQEILLYIQSGVTNHVLFRGRITSLTTSMVNEFRYFAEISATSYLSELLVIDTGGNGFSSEGEKTRMNNVLDTATANEWEDLDSITTWEFLGEQLPNATWNDFQTLYSNNFTWAFPGANEYTLVADASGTIRSAYDILADLISNLRGRLYEKPLVDSTTILYKARSELQGISTTSYLTLTQSQIIRDATIVSADFANLINDVRLTNGTDSVSAANFESIVENGLRVVEYEVELSNAADMQTIALEMVQASSELVPAISTVGVVVADNTFDDDGFKRMIEILNNPLSVLIVAPREIGGGERYLVVGTTSNYRNGQWVVYLNLASRNTVAPSIRWSDVSAIYNWNNYQTSTTTWAEIS